MKLIPIMMILVVTIAIIFIDYWVACVIVKREKRRAGPM